MIQKVSKKRAVKTTCTFPNNQWFDDDCKRMKSSINAYASSHDITEASQGLIHRGMCKEYKRLIQSKKRNHHRTVRLELEHMATNNPQRYWEFRKKHKKPLQSDINITEFSGYFATQAQPPTKPFFDEMDLSGCGAEPKSNYIHGLISDEILNRAITEEEVFINLKKLKNNKAPGSDGISAEFLKSAEKELVLPLTLLFNYVLQSGEYPTDWCQSIINPLHKKGCTENPNNYRKITVLPALGKLFESILTTRLTAKNDILLDNDIFQSGFMKNRMTTDNAFILYSLIMKQKFLSKPLYVCFVDFTKAFDYVNRAALLFKLRQRGVKGRFLDVIESMFNNSRCRVKVNGELSGEIDSLCGVLQGGMISPKLFNEYLCDIRKHLSSKYGMVLNETIVQYILYADDLALCSDSPEGLQEQLNGMFEYCKKWHMIISLLKTKVLVFNKKKPCDEVFTVGGNIVEIADEYKYLGFIFNTRMNDAVGTMPDYLIGQARKATYQARKLSNAAVGQLSPKLAFKVFDSQILPILLYGSQLWYKARQNHRLETFHLGYLKRTIGLRLQTPTDAVLSDTGRFPLQLRRNLNVIKYWLRMLNLQADDPLRNAFDTLVQLHNLGQSNWWTEVTTLLASLEISDPESHELNLANKNNKLLDTLKEKVYSTHMENCMARIKSNTEGKLRIFRTFKQDYCMEGYLLLLPNLRIHYGY